MLEGETVILRSLARDDLRRLWEFNNDVEVELASGGEKPIPQSFVRLQTEFDAEAGKGGRDGTRFAVEVDGKFIGHCALFQFDEVAQTCALGITIGDKAYWGRGYGREAIQLLLDYAFRLRNIHRVYLSVNGNNERANWSLSGMWVYRRRTAACSCLEQRALCGLGVYGHSAR